MVQGQPDAQLIVEDYGVEPGVIRRRVEKHHVFADAPQGLRLGRCKTADGHHTVCRHPLRRYKALPSRSQGKKRIFLIQAGLLHIAAEVEVKRVPELLGRREHLRHRHPEQMLGRASAAALGGGVIQPPRLFQHPFPRLLAHRQRGVPRQNARDRRRRVASALRQLPQCGHSCSPFIFTKNIVLYQALFFK